MAELEKQAASNGGSEASKTKNGVEKSELREAFEKSVLGFADKASSLLSNADELRTDPSEANRQVYQWWIIKIEDGEHILACTMWSVDSSAKSQEAILVSQLYKRGKQIFNESQEGEGNEEQVIYIADILTRGKTHPDEFMARLPSLTTVPDDDSYLEEWRELLEKVGGLINKDTPHSFCVDSSNYRRD